MKADNVRRRYGKTSPVGTANVVLALETCAEELEEELRRAPSAVPSYKLQVEGFEKPRDRAVECVRTDGSHYIQWVTDSISDAEALATVKDALRKVAPNNKAIRVLQLDANLKPGT